MARDVTQAPLECHSIDESGEAGFDLTETCPIGLDECDSVFFVVTVDHSMMRCLGKVKIQHSCNFKHICLSAPPSENRCRFPDQLLLIMRHRGLRCQPDDRSAAAIGSSGMHHCMLIGIFVMLGIAYLA